MTYLIEYPGARSAEAEWAISVVMSRVVGPMFESRPGPSQEYVVKRGELELRLPNLFFARAAPRWLAPGSLPVASAEVWDLSALDWGPHVTDARLPVMLGSGGFAIDEDGLGRLELDVFGVAFFMLSRYEEAVVNDRDEHGRVPPEACLGPRMDCLERPIVDEYVEVLRAAMTAVWSDVQARADGGVAWVSCDVDRPYSEYVASAGGTIRKVGGDFLKRRSVPEAIRSMGNAVASRMGYFGFDPYDSFDWIMDVNERAGNRVTFHFLAGGEDPVHDGSYSIRDRRIRDLIHRIADRGHEIGLHGSYRSIESEGRISSEVSALESVLDEVGIRPERIVNRQHYLRWDPLTTPREMERARIDVDCTLGFAQRPGFRCGTCHPFPMFDLTARRPLSLVQDPLIVMEDSLLAPEYLGLDNHDEALSRMQTLKARALAMGGRFTLLWHNSSLVDGRDRELYTSIVAP